MELYVGMDVSLIAPPLSVGALVAHEPTRTFRDPQATYRR